MKKILLILAVWLLVSAVNLPGLAAAVEAEALAWKGSVSAQKEPLSRVVETPEAWSALWRRAFDRPAPAVDFGKYVVACIFLGHAADWLYSIGFDAPRRRGGDWVITYGLHPLVLELAGPFRAGGQYHLKAFERMPGGRMVLEEERPTLLGR